MSSALDVATELLSKEGRPAYVEFSTIAKELPRRSKVEGRYVAVDVDVVTVRQVGATDSVIFEVERWLTDNEAAVRAQRLSAAHAQHYAQMYQRWKAGQALPVEGTPIKGWAVISPAQQESIVRAGVRTVEDLATMNAEAMGKIGMGAVMLKHRAQAWVAQAQDKGPLTMEMADLKSKNELLELQLVKMQEQIAGLQQESRTRPIPQNEAVPAPDITANDILDAIEPVRRPSRRKEG